MYNSIKDFLALVRRSNLKKDNTIRMSIDEANKLQAEISLLLVELKESGNKKVITFDGGSFK